MTTVPSSFDEFETAVAGLSPEASMALFDELPAFARRSCWNGLAAECAEHAEHSRRADPDGVRSHRPPRVGRLWGTRTSARPLPTRSRGPGARVRAVRASDPL